MQKIYYNNDGWICDRYPTNFEISSETKYIEVSDDDYQKTFAVGGGYHWRVKNNELICDIFDQSVLDKQELENELNALLQWFTWYDTQVIQYQRDIRLEGESQINIENLDLEAKTTAKRIKEIRELIKD